LIAAGSLVTPRKRLEGGWLHAGSPAVPVRPLANGELAAAAAAIRGGTGHTLVRSTDLPPLDMAPFLDPATSLDPVRAVRGRHLRAYVAPTAVVRGDVSLAEDAGVYFACAVVAGDGRIDIGPRTNIQDNSLLVTDRARGPIVLGAAVTIGHNVRMGAAMVEDDALIGMASQLDDGVIIERGGCVAARAWVERGTIVKAGWIWAGRPARAFRELKDSERASFQRGCDVYIRYGKAYLAAIGA
jgi:carbonic anhydrase/acetyltransferase-like protein (isoleucine patch superfamily)